MTDERYRFDVPRNLLCRQDRDPAVVAVFGAAIGAIDLRDLNSHLELQAKGFDVVFKRAPFVVAADEVLNKDYLHVAAFHFRQEEHDGYAQYSLALPGNITFSDTSDTVRSKLGEPERVGGGAYLTLLKQIAPRFWHYPLGTDQLHIEFDNADRVHTVTCKSRDGLVNWLAAEACRTVSFANQKSRRLPQLSLKRGERPMTDERYRFDVLRGLLRHPNRDPAVVAVFGAAAIDAIDLRDFYSYLELQAEGFDVVFQKAPFVVAADEILNEDDLHIAAYHFRREGHDGFAEYSLALPGGVMFGDTSDIVRSKLGDPERVGGGIYVPLLKKNAPRFWRYLLGTDQLNIRLDDAERVQMVTLQVPSRLDELAAAASGPAPR